MKIYQRAKGAKRFGTITLAWEISQGEYQCTNTAYCLFEGAIQPSIVDNILNGDRRILQVLKRVHEDEIEDDVIEVQMLHLIEKHKEYSD